MHKCKHIQYTSYTRTNTQNSYWFGAGHCQISLLFFLYIQTHAKKSNCFFAVILNVNIIYMEIDFGWVLIIIYVLCKQYRYTRIYRQYYNVSTYHFI